jgi:hypothetical protein
MAKYLSNIDLNKNQLQNAALHPVATAPATPAEGQVYFDTTAGDKMMYFWDGTAWVAMGSQGDITEIQTTTSAQLTITDGGGPIPSLAIVTSAVTNGGTALATGDQIYDFVTGFGYGIVDSVDVNGSTFINVTDGGTAADPVFTVSLSATGTPSSTTFLRGDNVWATVGDITAVTAGTYLNGGGTSGDVTVNHDLTSRTDTTSSASPAHGGTFTAVDSVTSNSTGHITAINLKTVTLPADTNTTSLPVKNSGGSTQFTSTDATGIRFAGTGSTTVSFTAGTQLVTIDSGNETITLSGDVTGSGTTSITTTISAGAVDFAMLNPAAIVTEAEGIANNDNDTTLPTSAAVKDYVDSNIVGGLIYQGGYNAATNTPDLDVSPSASIKQGWTYTVTADGSFFTEQVRVGDVLIAETNAPTSLADWTTVQNNIDLASTTTVGIASFSSDNFAVSAAGHVKIKNDGVILGTETTGNYVATVGEGSLGIDIAGSGYEGAAVTVSLDLNELTVTTAPSHLAGNDGSGNTRKFTIASVADEIAAANGYSGLIGGSTSTTINSATHGLGADSSSFMIQLVEVGSGDTVFADVSRGASGAVTISFATAPAANAIRVLIQKIG